MNNSENNKRIAKNTVFLYARTLVVMLVTLFTNRVLLQELGETDFGIYNLIGGIVILFTFLNSAMSTAVQRFLNIELGKNNNKGAEQVFCMGMNIHISLAVIVFILSETIGLWFVASQLNIPADRYYAVHWVYQFSILGVCANIIRIPYNGVIIAYEKMSFFAKISLIEAFLKLLIVYLLIISPTYKLIFYSGLMLLVILIINLQYYFYCKKKTSICNFYKFWDKALFKNLFGFFSWSTLSSASNAAANQGVNILYNIFCGVVVNAAMGITNLVYSAVSSFVANYQLAFSPQLTKSYAAKDYGYFCDLIIKASRFSYYLIFIIGIPCIFCCDTILSIWLVDVPEFTVQFTQLMIIFCLVEATSGPIWISVQAIGKLKNYQLLMSSIIILNLPIAYVLLKLGFSPVSVVFVRVVLCVVCVGARLFYFDKLFNFPTLKYSKEVFLNCLILTVISIPISFYLTTYISNILTGLFVFFIIFFMNIILVLSLGLKRSERNIIFNKMSSMLKQCL